VELFTGEIAAEHAVTNGDSYRMKQPGHEESAKNQLINPEEWGLLVGHQRDRTLVVDAMGAADDIDRRW
jgi:hypothetical protein